MTLQCVIHYQHLKNTGKIIPLNQHKFKILNHTKETRRKFGRQKAHDEQSKSMPPSLDSSKYNAHTECYKRITMSSNIPKSKSKAEGTSTSKT